MSVYIRPPLVADQELFITSMQVSRHLHQPWLRAPQTAGEFQAYLAKINGERNRGYLILDASNEALLGVVNLNELIGGCFHNAFLAYYATTAGSGRGLIRQGVSLVISEAFTVLGLHRLEANIQPANSRSLKLISSLGFRYEGLAKNYLFISGQWRDHARYALTCEEWSSQPAKAWL